MCHNVNGKGATMLASNVSPPPPDLTERDTQELTDAQLFAIIRDGVRFTSMPSWREMHTDVSATVKRLADKVYTCRWKSPWH